MNTSAIPRTFPTATLDRAVSAVFCKTGDIMIQMEIDFAHRLDPDRLRSAMDLILDAEPILGCRFVYRSQKPFWERLPRDGRDNFQVFSSFADYDRCKRDGIDPARGPALTGGLLSESGDGGCKLLLKVAHEASDAGSFKEAARQLGNIYTRLSRQPHWRPEPKRNASRRFAQVARNVPPVAYPRIFLNYLKELKTLAVPRNAYNPPLPEGPRDPRRYEARHIRPGRVRRIREYGRARGAKINDMVVAAFLRSVLPAGWDGKTAVKTAMTVDLRRWYMPESRSETICNLSAFEFMSLGTQVGETFEDTLEKVARFTRKRKKSWIGLNALAGPLWLFRLCPYQKLIDRFSHVADLIRKNKTVFPIFTNLGPMGPDGLVFDRPATRAWIIPPAGFPPFCGVGLSGYNGWLTVSSASFPSTLAMVGEMLDRLVNELPR